MLAPHQRRTAARHPHGSRAGAGDVRGLHSPAVGRDGHMDWLPGLTRLDSTAWLALLYLGLLASVVVVILQAWGQQRVDAMRSAIVFGLEPVFASLTAWFLLGESLGWAGVGGAALIVTALVVSQLQPASGAAHPASPAREGLVRALAAAPMRADTAAQAGKMRGAGYATGPCTPQALHQTSYQSGPSAYSTSATSS